MVCTDSSTRAQLLFVRKHQRHPERHSFGDRELQYQRERQQRCHRNLRKQDFRPDGRLLIEHHYRFAAAGRRCQFALQGDTRGRRRISTLPLDRDLGIAPRRPDAGSEPGGHQRDSRRSRERAIYGSGDRQRGREYIQAVFRQHKSGAGGDQFIAAAQWHGRCALYVDVQHHRRTVAVLLHGPASESVQPRRAAVRDDSKPEWISERHPGYGRQVQLQPAGD